MSFSIRRGYLRDTSLENPHRYLKVKAIRPPKSNQYACVSKPRKPA